MNQREIDARKALESEADSTMIGHIYHALNHFSGTQDSKAKQCLECWPNEQGKRGGPIGEATWRQYLADYKHPINALCIGKTDVAPWAPGFTMDEIQMFLSRNPSFANTYRLEMDKVFEGLVKRAINLYQAGGHSDDIMKALADFIKKYSSGSPATVPPPSNPVTPQNLTLAPVGNAKTRKFDLHGIGQQILQMDSDMRNHLMWKNGQLQEGLLFGETGYGMRQLKRRKGGEHFSESEHLEALIYSLLSAQRPWIMIERNKDTVSRIFSAFDLESVKNAEPLKLKAEITANKLGNLSIEAQMQSLKSSIEKFEEYARKSRSIDNYYDQFIAKKGKLGLVKHIADEFKQLGIPLAAEYLRNVGFDLPKPDTLVSRILGRNYLGASANQPATEAEVFDVIAALATELDMSQMEVDYILWSYCAKDYCQDCGSPTCDICIRRRGLLSGIVEV